LDSICGGNSHRGQSSSSFQLNSCFCFCIGHLFNQSPSTYEMRIMRDWAFVILRHKQPSKLPLSLDNNRPTSPLPGLSFVECRTTTLTVNQCVMTSPLVPQKRNNHGRSRGHNWTTGNCPTVHTLNPQPSPRRLGRKERTKTPGGDLLLI